AALVQVRQEAAAGLVVGMRDVVAGLHALAGDLAYTGHVRTPRSAPSKVPVVGPHSPGAFGLAGRRRGPEAQRAGNYAPEIRRIASGWPCPGSSRGGGCPGTGCRPR